MKVVKRIKQRLFRGYFHLRSHIHVHHWRGHGIHSPFMYGIVRRVFMKNGFVGQDRQIYEALRSRHVGHSQSVKLQNLYTHCGMKSFKVFPDETFEADREGENTLYVLLGNAPLEAIALAAQQANRFHGTLAVLSPHRDQRRWHFVQQIRLRYSCVSVDRKIMALYFFNPKLTPQHYCI